MEILKSKKFQAALVSLVVVIAAKQGFKVDEATMLTIVSPFLTYIAGQAVADVGKEKEKAKAKVEAEAKNLT